MEKTSIFYITDNGRILAEQIAGKFPGAEIVKFAAAGVPARWEQSDSLIFIMASGIVVRTIAPLLRDKRTDPAVVVLDEAGKYAISLAGGHLGGANELTRKIASVLGAEAVITTASDVNDLPSIDLWARDNDLVVENWSVLPVVATRYLNNGGARVYCEVPLKLPDVFLRVVDPRFADIIITNLLDVYAGAPRCSIVGEECSSGACKVTGQLYLRPRNLVIGIGCNSGTEAAEIDAVVRSVLEGHNLSFLSVESAATIDIKAREPGLRAFCDSAGLTMHTFAAEELNSVEGIEGSDRVFKATGAYAVSGPAARLAAGADKLLVQKQKNGNVTVAIALRRSGP